MKTNPLQLQMEKETIKVKKSDKWIELFAEGKEKGVRFRRNSNRGIILESTLNNPKGIKTELLDLCCKRKQAVEKLSDKEQEDLIKKWQIEEIREMANVHTRALALLSNGKIYIEQNEKTMRMIVPEELRSGFAVLMDLVNPEDKEKRATVKGEKLQTLNDFFAKCNLDLKGIEEGEAINFTGSGTKQLAQFMKSCVGYDIKEPELF